MLDYEINKYIVEYTAKNDISVYKCEFGAEEYAIDFIKKYRDGWSDYKLTQIRIAIIDF